MSNPATSAGASRNVDLTIGTNVHMLMWRRGETQAALAPYLGINPAALSHKIRGRRPWFAGEIAAVARRYGVDEGDLFKKLPGVDSNHEPIGSWFAASARRSRLTGLLGARDVAPPRRAQ